MGHSLDKFDEHSSRKFGISRPREGVAGGAVGRNGLVACLASYEARRQIPAHCFNSEMKRGLGI